MTRRLLQLIICLYYVFIYAGMAFSQTTDELFTTVVFLKGQYSKEVEINNIKYELWIKKHEEAKLIPIRETITGTGFFIQDPKGTYLVTAEHIAKYLIYDVKVTVHGKGDVPLEFELSQLTGNVEKQHWVIHPEADVAVLKLQPKINLREHVKTLPVDTLVKDEVSFDKNRPLTTIGFPLDLGLRGKFSPIIKTAKSASGHFRYKRFDKNQESNFFILDDTSVAGFSGAPVFALPDVRFGGVSLGVGSFLCVGLVHGTISDNTGGKFAAIVPSSYILDTIKQLTDSLK